MAIPSNAALPRHVAVIMDGNGRWATQRRQPRTKGHLEGLSAAKRIAGRAAAMGIRYLTLYVFSTENWKRTQEEVGYLMTLIKSHLRQEFDFYRANGIRILCMGNRAGLPGDVQEVIAQAERETAQFDGLTVVLAINYGGRDELVRAARSLAQDAVPAESIDEDAIFARLDVPEVPDADLIIRTGGEKRLSNFLLWRASYAELYFCDTLWPDFSEREFEQAVNDFATRQRRFGAVVQEETA